MLSLGVIVAFGLLEDPGVVVVFAPGALVALTSGDADVVETLSFAFFAVTEEEARQIILDYQEYLKTNNGGEMEKFLDYMTEQSKTRDDFAY